MLKEALFGRCLSNLFFDMLLCFDAKFSRIFISGDTCRFKRKSATIGTINIFLELVVLLSERFYSRRSGGHLVVFVNAFAEQQPVDLLPSFWDDIGVRVVVVRWKSQT